MESLGKKGKEVEGGKDGGFLEGEGGEGRRSKGAGMECLEKDEEDGSKDGGFGGGRGREVRLEGFEEGVGGEGEKG